MRDFFNMREFLNRLFKLDPLPQPTPPTMTVPQDLDLEELTVSAWGGGGAGGSGGVVYNNRVYFDPEPIEVIKARRLVAARKYAHEYWQTPREEREPIPGYVERFIRIYEGR